jgi:hypothetical protein
MMMHRLRRRFRRHVMGCSRLPCPRTARVAENGFGARSAKEQHHHQNRRGCAKCHDLLLDSPY